RTVNTLRGWIIVLIVGAAAGVGGFFIGAHHHDEDESTTKPSEEDKAVAQVAVAPIRVGAISETITAYGSIVAQPGEVRIISVPFESRIGKVLVSAGEQLATGTA